MNWGNEIQKKMHVQFLLNQHAFLKNPDVVCPYLPDVLGVDISNRCNIRCISCFHDIEKFKPMEDMTFDTLKLVLDQAEGRASRIGIGNHGEPFLHKDVFKIIEEIKKRGFFLTVINNGTLLNKERSERLADIGVDRLVFSVDSVDPDIYPKIRRGANFKRTLKNILYFIRLNYEKGLKNYINISAVNTNLALQSKTDIFEYFSNLPVHVIHPSLILNFHDQLPIREETNFYKKYQDIKDPEKMPVCINGFDRILIRPNGNVSLCDIDWDSVHILGNVKDRPYTELWNNEKAQEFRHALFTRDYSGIEKKNVLCSKCDSKWDRSLEDHRNFIVNLLDSEIKSSKKEVDEQIYTSEKYENLLEELHKLEK